MSQIWKKISEEPQKVGYKYVTIKTFEMPDGQQSNYTTWHRTGGQNVAVLALTPDRQVIVARQYRPGPERVLDEIPGGDSDDGEELAAAAARELLEETGYASDESLIYLGTACRDAYTNETDSYFMALNAHKVTDQDLDDGEYVEVALISIDQLLENAKTGKMSDAVAVLMAYDRLKELQDA